MPKQEPSGEVPDASVSGSQGVFVGSGNQYNSWVPKPPLDPATLGALNPHTAVSRLQKLSHDELVDFFAKASPDDVSEILTVFSNADLPKLATALADISRGKATELIRAVGTNSIDQLPRAAEAIASRAARLRWTAPESLEIFDTGYARRYENGHVFWSYKFGTRTTVGAIDDFCMADKLKYGFPVDDQRTVRSSPSSTDGIMQRFESGAVYSSKYGTYFVTAYSSHEEEEGVQGWLGLPTEQEGNGEFAYLQKFERGTVYTYIKEGPESFAVPQAIADILPGGWRPVSQCSPVKSSSGKGQIAVYVESVGERRIFETAVYWDQKNKPVIVDPEVWDYYSNLGAEKSWLGFPASPAIIPSSRRFRRQIFEGGTTYWKSGVDPISVRKVVEDHIFQDLDLLAQLGFPVSEEQPVGTGTADTIQFFQRGAVTCRDDKCEILLHPERKSVKDLRPPVAEEDRQSVDPRPDRRIWFLRGLKEGV